MKPPLVAAAATARIRAVDADYVSLTIRVPKEFMADLDQVAAALSHIVPNRKPADVLWECIRRTLAERARRKGGLPSRFTPAPGVNAAPSASGAPFTPAPGVTAGSPDSGACLTPAPGVAAAPSASGLLLTPAPGVNAAAASASVSLDSRYVPMEVARAVWEKDEGCCAFVAPDGRRCRSTHQLEIHHRLAHALGGPTSAPNLNLYCRRHNLLAAERDFGADLIDSFRRST